MRASDARRQAAHALEAAHVPSARVDAELLVAHVLGITRAALAGAGELTRQQHEHLDELVRQRCARVPLQHLTGSAPFRHLVLAVGPGVFIPRPETEVLVSWALDWLRTHEPARRVVDLCAGSGAIGVSIATEAWDRAGDRAGAGGGAGGGVEVTAVETDPQALAWLRRNVAGLAVRVVEGDATDPAVLSTMDGQVDLVVANPPYVPHIGAAGLPPEVRAHDPAQAVFGGTDGLDVIRPLIGRAAALLRPGGAVAIEHDESHAYVVPTLVAADGRLDQVRLHHDLAQRPRFTTARRVGADPGVADLPS
jgi:release factor glutamine methyltransferase